MHLSFRQLRMIVYLIVGVGLAPHRLMATGDVPVNHGGDLKIKPPLPIWPGDYETITERRPIFRINVRHRATRYRAELATNPRFDDPIKLTARAACASGPIASTPAHPAS